MPLKNDDILDEKIKPPVVKKNYLGPILRFSFSIVLVMCFTALFHSGKKSNSPIMSSEIQELLLKNNEVIRNMQKRQLMTNIDSILKLKIDSIYLPPPIKALKINK